MCWCRGQLKCESTHAETRFRLSAKRTSPFKSAGASVPSTTGRWGVRISGSNAGYTMFRGSVKGTGYPLYSPVSPSLPLPCVTVCHHISTAVYLSVAASWEACGVVFVFLITFVWLYLAVCMCEIHDNHPCYYCNVSFWRPLWIAFNPEMHRIPSVFVQWYCLVM